MIAVSMLKLILRSRMKIKNNQMYVLYFRHCFVLEFFFTFLENYAAIIYKAGTIEGEGH